MAEFATALSLITLILLLGVVFAFIRLFPGFGNEPTFTDLLPPEEVSTDEIVEILNPPGPKYL